MDIRSSSNGISIASLFIASFGAILLLASCASAPPSTEKPRTQLSAAVPEWHVGDRWCYAWMSGTDKGVKTSEVVGIREAAGVRYYILRVGTIDRYYTLNLGWAANVANNRVAARIIPPQPWFMWPLEVGKKWEYNGVFEGQDRKDPVRESYSVLAMERVEVPAGTYQAFKLVREGGTMGSDQYWYSPEVRWYVKWIGRRGTEEFQEVLQGCDAGAKPGQTASSKERKQARP